MAFTTCSVATNNISMLEDQPNDVGGLTAAELKAAFDKFGKDFVAWFNETHVAELDGLGDTLDTHLNDGVSSGVHGMGSIASQDYEEGNWTPVLIIGGKSDATYDSQIGRYQKIGKLVFIEYQLIFSNKGSGEGNVSIGGLPFVTKNDSLVRANSIGTFQYISLGSENAQLSMQSLANSSQLNILICKTGSFSAISLKDTDIMTGQKVLRGNFLYQTN
jgi:hypothetical protein